MNIKSHRPYIDSLNTLPNNGIVIFNSSLPIETMFYLENVTAYGFSPPKSILDSLKAENHLILFEENGKLNYSLNKK